MNDVMKLEQRGDTDILMQFKSIYLANLFTAFCQPIQITVRFKLCTRADAQFYFVARLDCMYDLNWEASRM